eukprot:1512952-Rhodomonas_salina.3
MTRRRVLAMHAQTIYCTRAGCTRVRNQTDTPESRDSAHADSELNKWCRIPDPPVVLQVSKGSDEGHVTSRDTTPLTHSARLITEATVVTHHALRERRARDSGRERAVTLYSQSAETA